MWPLGELICDMLISAAFTASYLALAISGFTVTKRMLLMFHQINVRREECVIYLQLSLSSLLNIKALKWFFTCIYAPEETNL